MSPFCTPIQHRAICRSDSLDVSCPIADALVISHYSYLIFISPQFKIYIFTKLLNYVPADGVGGVGAGAAVA